MCTTVDGYKLFRVTDHLGISHVVAGRTFTCVKERAIARGITKPEVVQWHECYREYAREHDEIERSVLAMQIGEMIYADIADNPLPAAGLMGA